MPGKKLNYNRKYPNANHQPCHKAAERIGRAEARQEASDALTLEQKIAKLPPEPFSKKERARLLAALAEQNASKNETPKTEVSEKSTEKQPKKYMKGS